MADKKKQWFPLESNPDVMNKYVRKLGFDPTGSWAFHDVMSTDEWALAMVPSPACAVLMLFPIKEASEKHKQEEEERIAKEGQEVSASLFYTKQTVGNACGTVGLLHACANAAETDASVQVTGELKSLIDAMRAAGSPEAAAAVLEGSNELETAHEVVAQEGQSAVPDSNESVTTHFVAFVQSRGALYELDGRKASAVNHGPTAADGSTLLADACKVVKQFMARDPGELRFTIVALAKGAPPS